MRGAHAHCWDKRSAKTVSAEPGYILSMRARYVIRPSVPSWQQNGELV